MISTGPTCRPISNGCARRSPERIFSLTEAPGSLRLFGRESIGSWFEQALVARRQEDFSFRAETEIAFDPEHFQQAAGPDALLQPPQVPLPRRYPQCATRPRACRSCHASATGRTDGFPSRLPNPCALPGSGPVGLAAEVDGAVLQFSYRAGGGGWRDIGPVLDASLISDEAGRGEHGSFTGAFVGMVAFDISGTARPADFSYFEYRRRA